MSSLAATLLMGLNETPIPLVSSVLWEILHKPRGKQRPVRCSQPHTLHDCRRVDEDGQSRALMSLPLQLLFKQMKMRLLKWTDSDWSKHAAVFSTAVRLD